MNILDFYVPQRCGLCDIELSGKNPGICPRCFHKLLKTRFNDKDRCSVCFHRRLSNGCEYCKDRNVFYDSHISFFPLTDELHPLLLRWKFENQRDISRVFGRFLVSWYKKQIHSFDYVGYIDSGKNLYKTRNYQPCKDLCAILRSASSSGAVARKKIYAKKQSMNDYSGRFLAIHDSFEIAGSWEKNDRILLIEDVFTTGATANEVARLLKLHGARSVTLMTIFFREIPY